MCMCVGLCVEGKGRYMYCQCCMFQWVYSTAAQCLMGLALSLFISCFLVQFSSVSLINIFSLLQYLFKDLFLPQENSKLAGHRMHTETVKQRATCYIPAEMPS